MSPNFSIDVRPALWAIAMTLGASLGAAGCQSSSGSGDPAATASAGASDASEQILLGAKDIVPPLLDDEGSPAAGDPKAKPSDAAAWTSRGLYASDAQAQMLTSALGDAALQVQIPCCGVEAIDAAVESTFARRAEHELPFNAPVFVRADDLRLAAAVANRLGSGGLANVWVVTP